MEENKNMEKEVLKELEENLWTYGSPVIFQSGIVYKGEKEGTVELTLTFANIFQKNIGEMNIQVNIDVYKRQPLAWTLLYRQYGLPQ